MSRHEEGYFLIRSTEEEPREGRSLKNRKNKKAKNDKSLGTNIVFKKS